MLVISSFEQSASLEVAITLLEQESVEKENIMAVPFEKRKEEKRFMDSIHRSDGVSLFDLSAALGTALSVIGASYGFVLAWGPIIWGLIGLAVGAFVGFIIDYFYTKRKSKNYQKSPRFFTEVVLIVECDEKKSELVEEILWENHALGVSIVENNSKSSPQDLVMI